jgi:glycosyltransferase involved in cell wall biosynthesis
MKIMILVPSFGKSSPICGAFLFAKYLHENDREVVFVSLDDNYSSKKNIVREIAGAGIDNVSLKIHGWPGLIRNRSAVQDYVREMEVDVVLAFELRPTLITSTLRNVLKCASVRGMFREAYPMYYSCGKVISHLAASVQIMALRKMDHVFSMTTHMSEWLVSEGVKPERIAVTDNFVDVRHINSLLDTEAPQDQTHIDIGMFCAFVHLKRIDVALRAITKVIYDYKHHNVRLHLAGHGPLYGKMRKLSCELKLEDKVTFHGFLTDPLSLMKAMNLVLLTSESEGVPRCLLEALSLGKTVIASDIQGVKE